MAQHHFEGDTKKFTLTAFLSFATVFCLLVLFSRCHGSFKPHHGGGGHGAATEHHEKGATHKDHQEATPAHDGEHKESTHDSTHH